MTTSYLQTNSPNALGRFLHWWTSGWAYARQSLRANQERQKRTIAMGLLEKLSTRHVDQTVDSTDAEILAITNYAVFTALRIIGSRVAEAKAWPKAMLRNGETLAEVKDHPFEQLLRHPNDQFDYGFIARYAVGWYLLRGAAPIFISTPAVGRGPPLELWPLPSNMVAPLGDTLRRSTLTGRITHDYVMSVKGQKYTLPGENVFYLRFPNFWSYWDGLSSLTAALAPIRTDIAQARWEEGFYREDNAVPTAIISLPPDISPDDFAAAKEAIRQDFGSGRASAITRAGDLSVEVIQQTMDDLQIRAARQFNRDQIFGVFGIPLGLVSGEIASDNVYAILHTFAMNTVQPLLDAFAAQWTLAIRPYYEDNFEAHAPDLIPQDRALNVQEYTIYANDRTINENRNMLSLAPLDIHICKEVPVRLLRLLQAPGDAAILQDKMGTLLGSEAPERLTNRLADEGTDVDVPEVPEDQAEEGEAKALLAAAKGELARWRKVALREAKKGSNPAEREFATAILPHDFADEIRQQLEAIGPEETEVKRLFATATGLLGDKF